MPNNPMQTLLMVVSILYACDATASAQDRSLDARRSVDHNAEQVSVSLRLAAALDRDYGNQPADDLLMLAIQHSDIAVPELKRRLSAYKQREQSPKKLEGNPALHADALAYVANALAVDALSDLCVENPGLFCPYLERTLDYSEGRLNPFTLAYRAVGRPETIVQDTAAHWANSIIGFAHFQQRLGEAMLYKYGKVPGDSEWTTDPICSRLKSEASPELRQRVLRFAAEAQSERERR